MLQRHLRESTGNSRAAPAFVFFDDLEQNLAYPKQLNWTTVWITRAPQQHRLRHVDYMFQSIHDALRFFLRPKK